MMVEVSTKIIQKLKIEIDKKCIPKHECFSETANFLFFMMLEKLYLST